MLKLTFPWIFLMFFLITFAATINDMNKLFTILFLLISTQISAAEKSDKTRREMIATVGAVTVSPNLIKPKMENLSIEAVDSRLSKTVTHIPAIRKQSKRYRPVSTPGLQKKMNWVFAY